MRHIRKYELFGGAAIAKQLENDLNAGENRWNKLMQSIVENDKSEFDFQLKIIDKTMILEEIDKEGNTALLLASKYGRLNMLKKLIEKDADIYHKNNDGKDFHDLANDRFKFINRVKDWIEDNYPEFVMAKKYNL
jgi:ankyrin repeat protein